MTPRQQRFVEEYLLDLNAHQAALRAGYSPRSARQIAAQLLRKPEIAEAIGQAMAARAERMRVSADRVIQELARVAFADIGRFLEADGVTLKKLDRIAADDRAAVQEVATAGKTGAVLRLRLHDKLRALDGLARHLGLYGKAARALSPEAVRAQWRADQARMDETRELIISRMIKLVEERQAEEDAAPAGEEEEKVE